MSIEHSDLYCGFLGAVARSDECFGLLSSDEGLAIMAQNASVREVAGKDDAVGKANEWFVFERRKR